MRRFASLVCAVALASAATGCGLHHRSVFVTGVVVGAAVVAASPRERVVVYEPVPVVISEPYAYVAPPARDLVSAERPALGFDPAAARNALANTRVEACAPYGGSRGYGHARVTFAPGGNVTRVVVDSPAGLSPETVSCIGRELGAAVVPPFAGHDATLGTNWFMR